MGIALEGSDAESVVRLDGAIDIASAAELKARLLEALSSGTGVRVSLEGARYLDATAVQLLWAAGRQARRSGVPFQLSGQLPDPLWAALADAGLQLFAIPVNAV
jgi:anti-anti-sigma factor